MSFASIDNLQSIVYQMEKGKFANIGFAIKENPEASRGYDGQSLSFHLYQNAGCRGYVDYVWNKVVT